MRLFRIVLISAALIASLSTGCSRPGVSRLESASSLRSINTACVVYAQTYPEKGFPQKLSQLGPPPSGEKAGPEHSFLIDDTLAEGKKSGYVYRYKAGSIDSKGRVTSYTFTASPIDAEHGGRSYFSDNTGIIRYTDERRIATASDEELK